MKKMVAYFEQFYKVLAQLFEQDINNIIAYYIKLIEIISIVLIVLLFIIVLAVHHRWTVMRSESKQVQSILSLISFNHIKVDKSMRETFMAIDYHFYDWVKWATTIRWGNIRIFVIFYYLLLLFSLLTITLLL